MSKPLIPGVSDPVLRMMQLRQGAMMSPVCHHGAHRMVSRYRLPVLEGLLGAQKVAVAEWNTEIFVMLSVVGQREREGVPVNIGCCLYSYGGPLFQKNCDECVISLLLVN